MTKLKLALFEDSLPTGCPPVFLPATPRALYVKNGRITVETPDSERLLCTDQASVEQVPVTLLNPTEPTVLWRWELTTAADHAPDNAPGSAQDNVNPALPSAPATYSVKKLEAEIDLDPRFEWLMRCDRVSFPPGGVALTHVHQGPGIRICLSGEITIETLGERHSHAAGQAWFELGHAPVLAPTTLDAETTFIRAFLLPRALKGRSSIRYVHAQDAQAAKVQRYCVFAERFIDLPARGGPVYTQG